MRCRDILWGALLVICVAQQSTRAESHAKASAIYAPRPEYPSLPNGQRPQGSGVFVFHVDTRTGVVRFVSVEKSTGSAILDKAAIDVFRRWKFKPGSTPTVKIPLTFSTHGLP
jgi:TonB family protein